MKDLLVTAKVIMPCEKKAIADHRKGVRYETFKLVLPTETFI